MSSCFFGILSACLPCWACVDGAVCCMVLLVRVRGLMTFRIGVAMMLLFAKMLPIMAMLLRYDALRQVQAQEGSSQQLQRKLLPHLN